MIWDEKNLTEHLTKLENNGENGANAITTDTKNKLKEKSAKDIRRAYQAKWRKNNKDKVKSKANKNWIKIKNNPLLLKKRNELKKQLYYKHVFSRMIQSLKRNDKLCLLKPFDLWKLAKRQKMLCALTGRKLNKNDISLDHIIPSSTGGTNNINNLRLTCVQANLAKLDYTDAELIKFCQDVCAFQSKISI